MPSNRSKQINKCQECGKNFNPWDSNLRAEFCSVACRGKSRQERIMKKCLICGKVFFACPYQIKDVSRNAGRYCSRACRIEATRTAKPRACKHCNGLFFGRPKSIYCSHDCHGASLKKCVDNKCETCGKIFQTRPSERQRYCSRKCIKPMKGKLNPRWTGGRYKAGTGYIKITINGKKYLEHRHLIEKKIGRKLRADEDVHHKNGIRDDNRLNNLQLMSKKAHSALHGKHAWSGRTYMQEKRTSQ